ncbi:tyrosine-protein phosphatase [Gulosibacter chungangensis]|nr:tyrosine-protein phosphatase [Gulosibacter chungangensis]
MFWGAQAAEATEAATDRAERDAVVGPTEREFTWAGSFNARDLGGIQVAGGVVRPNVLFRSGKPEAWEAAGFAQAAAAGVHRIIDLRDPAEPGGVPELSEGSGIDYYFSPIEDPQSPAFKSRFQPYMNHTSGYLDFLGMFGDRVARTVGTVLDAGPGTLICCSAGRDRTGLLTSVILLALGADTAHLQQQDELAVRVINERHRGLTHPYESWQPPEIVDEMVASRRQALEKFVAAFNAQSFLTEQGVSERAVAEAREWLVLS